MKLSLVECFRIDFSADGPIPQSARGPPDANQGQNGVQCPLPKAWAGVIWGKLPHH